MKLPKELKEKQKKKVMKIRKKEFKPSREIEEIEEKDELLMKAFLLHCHIKKIPIADLDLSEISDHWENFLDKLERNKDKKNIYSKFYKVWSENLKKELKRVKETKAYTTQSPLDDDRDLRETLIRNIF